MAREIRVYGYVKSNQLHFYNREAFLTGLPNFEHEDVEVILRSRVNPFKDSQRGYYFGVICRNWKEALYYAWGEKYTITEVDYMLRELYLYREHLDEDTGEIHKEICTLRKGETDVSEKEMRDFCRYLIQLAAYYLRWPIPLPLEELGPDERVQKRRTIAEQTATR